MIRGVLRTLSNNKDLFTKIVNYFQPLTIFAKSFSHRRLLRESVQIRTTKSSVFGRFSHSGCLSDWVLNGPLMTTSLALSSGDWITLPFFQITYVPFSCMSYVYQYFIHFRINMAGNKKKWTQKFENVHNFIITIIIIIITTFILFSWFTHLHSLYIYIYTYIYIYVYICIYIYIFMRDKTTCKEVLK